MSDVEREAGQEPELDAPPRRREPVFNLPRVLTVAIAVMWLVHLFRTQFLTGNQDFAVLFEFAFIPARYAYSLADQSPAWLWSPLTYSFLHGNLTHLVVNTIWMAAFGAVVARRIGAARFCVFWVATAVAAVALHLPLHWGEQIPVIGASGVVSGLMGAAARFAFPRSGRFHREKAHLLPRQSLGESLTNRTVIVYLAVWFGINALAAFGFGADPRSTAQIAWEAHIGGFLFGFLAFGLFDRREPV